MGLGELRPEELLGGSTVEESARIFLSILEGRGTAAQNDVVIANAGMALYCANRASGLEDGIDRARVSLESGKACQTFKKLLTLNA